MGAGRGQLPSDRSRRLDPRATVSRRRIAQVGFSLLTACATAVLLAVRAQATEVTEERVDRYSIDQPVAMAAVHFTLLEPSWLLPPVESLHAAAALEHDGAIDEQVLQAPATDAARPPSPGGPVTYSLSDRLSAQVRYRHSFLFGTGTSTALRSEGPRTYSSRPDRDVLGLAMSWRLAGSTVGLGYQLESARERAGGADAGVTRFLPGSEQATHSFTLGLTREWGSMSRPPLIDAPIPAEDAEAPVPIDPTPGAAAAQ